MPKKCRLKLFTNDRSFISLDRILNIFRVNVLVVSTESRLGKFWISFFLNPDSYIKGSRRELPARILHAILVKRERSTKALVTISYIKLFGMIDICTKRLLIGSRSRWNICKYFCRMLIIYKWSFCGQNYRKKDRGKWFVKKRQFFYYARKTIFRGW